MTICPRHILLPDFLLSVFGRPKAEGMKGWRERRPPSRRMCKDPFFRAFAGSRYDALVATNMLDSMVVDGMDVR